MVLVLAWNRDSVKVFWIMGIGNGGDIIGGLIGHIVMNETRLDSSFMDCGREMESPGLAAV